MAPTWSSNITDGTIISYAFPRNGLSSSEFVPEIPNDHSNESYIGYSISSGRFFEGGRWHVVSGAPRDGDNKGRVYIFEPPQANKKSIVVTLRFEGEKVGEYFGACVLGVDVNGDSYTDLLVGSPFYSLRSGGDEGKVYVYMSSGKGLGKTQEIMGSKTTESRFGTAIANAGDLNQDGFTDIAVGAPYEDGGVVYIYHGYRSGIVATYAQRISARSIIPSISGFGISISRGKDVDDNHYPDLLIGSYLSDQAVLYRTRPIVKVYSALSFNPLQINRNSSVCSFNNHLVPCFNISVCLRYTTKHTLTDLDISIRLDSARKREVLQKRRYLLYRNQLSSYLEESVVAKDGLRNCFNHTAYVASDSKDFITPIQITLTHHLTHDVSTEKGFCKSCPVLDPTLSSSVTRTITFQTGCGKDSTCVSDLNLKANVR